MLVTTVDRDAVDAAIAGCGVGAQRAGGKLPPHVVAYLTMALCLLREDDYEEVVTKVTGSLAWFGGWDASWSVPTSSGITQARKRLGPAVMEEIFTRIAQPVATSTTIGAWLRRWRLLAIDGFEVDLPDTDSNAEEFGYSGSGDNRSPLPKARVVALAECGTHVFLAATIGAWNVGEKTLATDLYPQLQPGELLTADRNFYSFGAWAHAASTGADLLWRAPTGLGLPVIEIQTDGTYTSLLVDPAIRGTRRTRLIDAARHGEEIDPELAHLVRVIEYTVPDRKGNGSGELIVLLSTITDPAAAGGPELAGAYHERWEQETANDQLKTHLRGPGGILRSRLAGLVHQEIWAWLIVHYAIAALAARAADAVGLDPDRISFLRTLRIVRRSVTAGTAFPPSGLD